MAEAEERHAQRWAEKLADLGEPFDDSRLFGRRLQRWLDVRSELRSRFAEWKQTKKNMKLHFAISESAFSPATKKHDVKDFPP